VTARARPRLWPVLLAAGAGLAILLALGSWQVQRLAWKQGLIAAIDQALAQEPVTLEAALARPDADFVKVKLSGTFEPRVVRLLAATAGGAGWDIIQGFTMPSGQNVLVVRGRAADGQESAAQSGILEITGILRRHAARATFDGDNDVAGNRWYWWDVPAMQAAALPGKAAATPLVLHLVQGSPGTEGLTVAPPKAELRNNHLGYAITWFGLAAALVAVTAVFLRQRANKADA
jgi:surfeit locus 1 family protein